jgi:3-isopropylmalate/(R)-2-methylmalate dehydratase large subunit
MSVDGTLFNKIWNRHVVADLGEGFNLLYVDRHVVPDFNGSAFTRLRDRGLKVRKPELTFATADHSVSTDPHTADTLQILNPHVQNLRQETQEFGVKHFDIGQIGHGIVHVITPEMGIALPGLTVTIGDSHTCTNGALGALAWGVGQGEIVHILATQTCVQQKPKTMRVNLEGSLPPGIGGKDLVLFIIGQLGVAAGNGFAVEYAGSAIESLPMESRFSLCNMSVEWGARYGMIAPDQITFDYVQGRPYAPKGEKWKAALEDWKSLATDSDAVFDHEVSLNVTGIKPQITWGNSLDMVSSIDGRVPYLDNVMDAAQRANMKAAISYMGLQEGGELLGLTVHRVFIGSCTNSRISDLRAAATIVKGRKVASHVKAWVVPGSEMVKRQAQQEGLDKIFLAAGFEWRNPGCSMCLSANGETIGPGERAISTATRNFAGRQGPGSRTHIASPAVAAASACAGVIADPNQVILQESTS